MKEATSAIIEILFACAFRTLQHHPASMPQSAKQYASTANYRQVLLKNRKADLNALNCLHFLKLRYIVDSKVIKLAPAPLAN
jgi:hypothetical protein